MDKVRLKIVGLSSNHGNSFAMILADTQSMRRLPIVIGIFEAQAIAIEIEKIRPHRPMTHDLFKSFAEAFEYHVTEILINDLREGVFFAKIVCTDGTKNIEIDARPSDAVAIGIRFKVPIYTTETILHEAGILDNSLSEEEEEENTEKAKNTEDDADELHQHSVETLEALLKEAIEKEEYEKAVHIRDIIKKKQKK